MRWDIQEYVAALNIDFLGAVEPTDLFRDSDSSVKLASSLYVYALLGTDTFVATVTPDHPVIRSADSHS